MVPRARPPPARPRARRRRAALDDLDRPSRSPARPSLGPTRTEDASHDPCPAPTAAPPTSCARSPSSATSPRWPPARCSSPSAAPGCCARRRIDEDVPRWMRGSGKGWVTAEYSMLPGSSPERIRPRGERRQADRAGPGDPAPDRPVAAGGLRHARARRAAGHRRLRRAAGRRRHPHGVDLRRLPGAARRARRASVPAGAHHRATRCTAFCAADLRRHRRRRPGARPALRRGLHGRGRHERGDDRAAAAASSRCRAPPRAWPSPAASSTRCSAWPRAGIDRDHRAAGRDASPTAAAPPAR